MTIRLFHQGVFIVIFYCSPHSGNADTIDKLCICLCIMALQRTTVLYYLRSFHQSFSRTNVYPLGDTTIFLRLNITHNSQAVNQDQKLPSSRKMAECTPSPLHLQNLLQPLTLWRHVLLFSKK